MKIKVIFAWYDLWIGFFFDMKKVKIYVFPIPMVGLEISLLPKGFYIDKVKSHWSPSPIYGEGGDLDTFILRRDDGNQVGAFKTLKKAVEYAKTLNHNQSKTP